MDVRTYLGDQLCATSVLTPGMVERRSDNRAKRRQWGIEPGVHRPQAPRIRQHERELRLQDVPHRLSVYGRRFEATVWHSCVLSQSDSGERPRVVVGKRALVRRTFHPDKIRAHVTTSSLCTSRPAHRSCMISTAHLQGGVARRWRFYSLQTCSGADQRPASTWTQCAVRHQLPVQLDGGSQHQSGGRPLCQRYTHGNLFRSSRCGATC